MLDYDKAQVVRNDVNALLEMASQMHYLAACSDISEVACQTATNTTTYDGTRTALRSLLALKWPGVNVEWLYDLWIDLMEVPSQRDVESVVLCRLNRDDATDPMAVAARAVDAAMYAKYGDDAYGESFDAARAAEANAIEKRVYAEQTSKVEAMAKEMARAAR